MVKVIFTNGKEILFNTNECKLDADSRLFVVAFENGHNVLLPDHNVLCAGIWNAEAKEFV